MVEIPGKIKGNAGSIGKAAMMGVALLGTPLQLAVVSQDAVFARFDQGAHP